MADTPDKWLLERSPNGTTGWAQIAELPGATTTFGDTELTPETTYYYRVRGMRGTALGPYSNVDSATTEGDAPAVQMLMGYRFEDSPGFDVDEGSKGYDLDNVEHLCPA